MNSQLGWDQYYLSLSCLVASKSKDPSTKCGAVIVSPENVVLGTGFNGFARGVKETQKAKQFPYHDFFRRVRYVDDGRTCEYEALHLASDCWVWVNAREFDDLKTECNLSKETELNDRWERPEKYSWVEHAERNAIYAAAREGVRLAGATMYITAQDAQTGELRAFVFLPRLCAGDYTDRYKNGSLASRGFRMELS